MDKNQIERMTQLLLEQPADHGIKVENLFYSVRLPAVILTNSVILTW